MTQISMFLETVRLNIPIIVTAAVDSKGIIASGLTKL